MGVMKDLDIRIRSGGDDAVAAVSELTEHLRLTDAEREAIEYVVRRGMSQPGSSDILRGLLERMK